MTEQLGDAVLTLKADSQALDAGLERARQNAEAAGKATEQAFTASGRAIQTAADGTKYFIDAQGRLRDISGRFLTMAEQQAAGIGNAWQAAAQGPVSSIRSIQALQERLSQLRSSFESVQIGSRGFQDLQREIQRTERELQQADRTMGGLFRDRAGGFAQSLLGALGLGVGIGAGAAAGGFLRSSIQQAVELETVTRKLSNTLGTQGAAGALNFTRGIADELGLGFKDLANSYAGFTAAATAANVPIETQNALFRSVSRAGQALGLSNDQINGSFLALQQVASKGTVAMEELRGQLGERLPIALAATARGLGISQQELIRLVETGRLTADRFFPALTKGLNELTSGAGGIPTAAQEFAKLGNAWQELQTSFGQNQLPLVTRLVRQLSEASKELKAQQQSFKLREAFGFETIQSEQVSGLLNYLRQQYNLTDQQAKNLTSQAVAAVGAEANVFRQRFLSAEQFAKLVATLPALAEEFRRKNADGTGELKRLAAEQERINREAKAAVVESQKKLDLDLRRNQAALEYRSTLERFEAAQARPGLNQLQLVQLENELKLNEKIRDVEAARLALKREQDKPAGVDGKDGRQSAAALIQLQAELTKRQLELSTLEVQNRQAEVEASRSRGDRLRQIQLENQAADQRLALTVRQTELERQALDTGIEVSRTARLRLQLQDQLTTATRQQRAAEEALAEELSRPEGDRSNIVTADLVVKLNTANNNVRQAYADAGKSLVENARSAADALKGAQEGLQSTLRGGFDLLTPGLQREQIRRARAAIQPLVERGVIRTGIDISTPDQLFRVASFAESFNKSESALSQALAENASATQALVAKDWQVFVDVQPAAAALPLPRT